MRALHKILLVALFSGIAAGIFTTAAQSFRAVPIILEAEKYEASSNASESASPSTERKASDHVEDEWKPTDGLERVSYTFLLNVLTAIGFSLLVTAALSLDKNASWRRGLMWGLAGFTTFTLAPSLGLPPEIPGAEAAPLFQRQVWWIGTAAASGAGLALIFLGKRPLYALAGVLLLVLPHLIGAPQPEAHDGTAPAALARSFVVTAIVISFLFWVILGSTAGYLYSRPRAKSS